MNLFNSQQVIVFNDYKFYKDEKTLEKDEKNLVDKELFIHNSTFDMHKYLLMNRVHLENDMRNWLEFEGVTLQELYDKIFSAAPERTAGENDKKYKSMITRYSEKEDDFKSYELQDIKGIYTELAKIEPFNIHDIIKFSNVFGLPTGILELTNQNYSGEYPITLQSVNYTELNSQLMKYKSLFDVFKDIKTEDIEGIKQKNIDFLDMFIKHRPEMSLIINIDRAFYSEESDEDILEQTKLEFIDLINVNHFFKGRLDYRDNTYFMESKFRDLFEYSYFQMSQALLNKSELKKCRNCGHLFEVTVNNTEFCPSLSFSEESQCKIEFENK